MNAPLSANMRRTSSRLGPGSGRKTGSRYSSLPEKYQSKRCSPPWRPSGSATPSSGPATNPSSDIVMSMTTLVMRISLLPGHDTVVGGVDRLRLGRRTADAHRDRCGLVGLALERDLVVLRLRQLRSCGGDA